MTRGIHVASTTSRNVLKESNSRSNTEYACAHDTSGGPYTQKLVSCLPQDEIT